MFIKSSSLVVAFAILLALVCAHANANAAENELAPKLGHLSSIDQDGQDGEFQLNEYPEWLKRALPRMGKRFMTAEDQDDELEGATIDSDDSDLFEAMYKRALPRMGRALPRMGRALPRMGRALPRMGRALPRMG